MNGRRLSARIALFILLITVTGIPVINVSAADEPLFIMEIADNEVDVDADTSMTITMVNAKGARIKEIVGSDWFYVPHSGTAITTEIYNGTMSNVVTETYTIYPYYAGKFKMWAMIEYEGKTYMTNKVELNVTDARKGAGQPVKAIVDTKLTASEVYIGQKVALSYEVYSLYELGSRMFLNDLKISDVLHKSVPEEKLGSGKTVIDGLEYYRYDVEKAYLTPIKSGLFVIPGRDFYGFIYDTPGLSDDEYSVRGFGEPKELIVKPLPSKNQPEDFSWIIGKLKIDAAYDTPDPADGGTIRLKVTASGDCSLDSLNKIFEEDPPGFSVYETETKYEETFENNKYNAVKEFEITLIPKEKGTLTVEPVMINYFDPESVSYKTAEIPGITVTVDGDDNVIQTAETRTGEDQAGEGRITETIRIEQVSYTPTDEGYWVLRINKTVLLIIVIVLPVIGAAVFLIVRRPFKRKGKSDDELDDIYARLLKTKDENEMFNHFNSMIKHCFGVSPKASSRSEIAAGIEDKRFVEPVLAVVDYFENRRSGAEKADKALLKMIKGVYRSLRQR